jgi:hypothetical protein
VADRLELDEYVKASEDVRQSLETLANAQDFQLEAGRVVHYAVDFSEIYAFINPTQSHWDSMLTFSERDLETAKTLHHAAISRIFFAGRTQLVLLDPYAIEFDDFANGLLEGALPKLKDEYHEAAAWLAHFSESEEFAELTALLGRARAESAGDSDNAALNAALEKLEARGGDLVRLLAMSSYEKPYWRLASLLDKVQFADGGVYEQVAQRLNATTIERWFAGLLKRRRASTRLACHLDAHAMAIVERAARDQDSTRRRLYLITRSRHMHELYAWECEHGPWKDNPLPYDPLIDPRTFAILPVLAEDDSPEGRRHESSELRNLALSIRVFVQMIEGRSLAGPDMPPRPDLEKQLEKTRGPWRKAAQLAASLYGDFREQLKQDARDKIVKAMLTVRNELTAPVEQRHVSLLKQYEDDHQDLTWRVAQIGQANRVALEFDDVSERSWLAASVHWMPYRLDFYSPEVREAMSVRPQFSALQEALRKSSRPDVRYERQLSIAYVLGTWCEWGPARDFCELALRTFRDARAKAEGDHESRVPDHEGHFLLAICRRELAKSSADYVAALDSLDTAAASRAASKGIEDPRYLKERALIIWRWNALSRHSASDDPRPPPAVEGLRLSLRALSLAGDDPPLLCQIRNNLCFYYLEHLHEPGARDHALQHYQELKALVDNGEFPVMYQSRDTLILAQHRLGLTTDRLELVRQLDELLGLGRRLRAEDLDTIKRHRSEILAGASEPAPTIRTNE